MLKSSLPLLKSRNTGVVLAVCALHHYCGSQSSFTTTQIGKALIRILRNRHYSSHNSSSSHLKIDYFVGANSRREVQYVVLNSINMMARERPLMFRPFLSEFFIKSSDPLFNRF